MKQFKKTGGISDNEILKCEGFTISYMPSHGSAGMGFMAGDNFSDETALIKDNQYYILNGDFRKEYSDLSDQGFEACFDFFKQNEDKKSSWSN